MLARTAVQNIYNKGKSQSHLEENQQNTRMWTFMYGFLRQFENIQIVNAVIYMGDGEGETFILSCTYISKLEKTKDTCVFYCTI